MVKAYINGRGTAAAREALTRVLRQPGVEDQSAVAFSELLISEGEFAEAETLLKAVGQHAGRFVDKEVRLRLQRLEVLRTTARIIESTEIAGPVRGASVLITHGSTLDHIWMIPLAAHMRRLGYATVILEKNGAPAFPPCGVPEIDVLHGMLDSNRIRLNGEAGPPRLRKDWTIDPQSERIEHDGIEIYRAVSARIGTKLRSYRFDWSHPLAVGILKECIYRADAALAICEQIHHQIGRQGFQIRFMGGMSHFPPAAVYRHYCDKRARADGMEYIAFTAGYEHYYTNLKNKTSTALSVANMTRHPELTLPSRVTRASFERWMKTLDSKATVIADTMRIIAYDRAGRTQSSEASSVREKIKAHRAAGGKVACLFGKILYDVWMDDPGGPAHADIADWLNHTIELVEGTKTLLLIKPHPNETKRLIARPTEWFSDLIQGRRHENVIVLDHSWFNTVDIVQMVDVGLIWSGTAALELQASGVPVVIASRWGLQDHPVKFFSPNDRRHYEELVRSPGLCQLDPVTQEECALLIKYYASEEVLIPHTFGVMPYLRGVDVGGVRWSPEKVEAFLNGGDPHVARLAQRVV